MRWTTKARIQKLCATIPGGDVVYRSIQRRGGALRADPFSRLPHHAEMLSKLQQLRFPVTGARCMEVGTGHVPLAPVAFYLAGAQETITVDLYRRLDEALTQQMLRAISTSRERVVETYRGLIPADALETKLDHLARAARRPVLKHLEALGIRYVAPADAANVSEPDESYDLHFSITVLEHVRSSVLQDILLEAMRLLRPAGLAAHLIDPSDHFSHQDPTISRMNFLRFTDAEWQRIGGNEYSYSNRLRASELEAIFRASGFSLEAVERVVEERCRNELLDGFPLSDRFRLFDIDDLCAAPVNIYARKPDSHAN